MVHLDLTSPRNRLYIVGEAYRFLVHVPLSDVKTRLLEIGSARDGVLMASLVTHEHQGTFCGEGGLLLENPVKSAIVGMSRVDPGGKITDCRTDSLSDLLVPAPTTEYNQIDLRFDGTKVVGVMLKVTPDGQELGNPQRNSDLREMAELHDLPTAMIEIVPAEMPTVLSFTKNNLTGGNTLTTYDIPANDDHFLRIDIAHGMFYHSPGADTVSRSMIIDRYGQVSQQLTSEQKQRIRQELSLLQKQDVVSEQEMEAVMDGFLS